MSQGSGGGGHLDGVSIGFGYFGGCCWGGVGGGDLVGCFHDVFRCN